MRFFVPGIPGPQGSKKHVGGGRMVEMSKKVKPWREAVKIAWLPYARDHQARVWPLQVVIEFILPRPKRKGLFKWHYCRPDLDKLIRSTLDALTQCGAIVDDSHVAHVTASKRYSSPGVNQTGAWIEIEEL